MGAWRVDLPKLNEVTVMDGALANCRNLVALGNDAAQWNIGRAFGKLRSVECRRTSAVGARLRAVVPGIRVIEKCHFLLKNRMSFFLGQAVVESCLYIVTDVPVLVGIVPGNEGLVIEIRKCGVSSVLRIHYHRISNLEVKTMILAMFAAVMLRDIDISKLPFM